MLSLLLDTQKAIWLLPAWFFKASAAPVTQRTCIRCGIAKPLSDFPAVKGKKGKTHYRKVCKTCRSAYEKAWRKENAHHVRDYQLRYYRENRPQILARVKAWQEQNRDYKLDYQRLWYLANQEERQARQREWYRNNRDKVEAYRQANRDKIAKRMKWWRQENADLIDRYQRDWRKANADKVLAYSREYRRAKPIAKRISEAGRRARKRGSGEHFTAADIANLYALQLGECVYCGVDLSDNFEVDHIVPLARGGSNDSENIQLLCPACNRRKHAKTHDEFLEWLAKQ